MKPGTRPQADPAAPTLPAMNQAGMYAAIDQYIGEIYGQWETYCDDVALIQSLLGALQACFTAEIAESTKKIGPLNIAKSTGFRHLRINIAKSYNKVRNVG